MKRKILTVAILFIIYVAGFMTAGMKPSSSSSYAVLLEDINLELTDRFTSHDPERKEYTYTDNPKMLGVIKKGSIVKTGNMIKGHRRGISFGTWVFVDQVKYIGDDEALNKYLTENEKFYSSFETSKGTAHSADKDNRTLSPSEVDRLAGRG